MFNILLAEDDDGTRMYIKTLLSNAGYNVTDVCDGVQALDAIENHHIDLFIVDVMMPRMDGYTFTRILRDGSDERPVLMVTAKQTSEDKKEGFISGTDDYIVKPFDEDELLLRVSALLRRAKIAYEKKLVVGSSLFDYGGMSVTVNGVTSELPQKEFLLIYKLLSNNNKIFTRRSLMDEIWSMDSDTDERTVDVHINRLRDFFRDSDDFDIVTVRGLGYKAVIKKKV